MGMDVHGKKPDSAEGEYFRANVWSWRPIADYMEMIAPPGTWETIKYPQSNDGDGLGAKKARKVGRALQEAIDSGATARHLEGRRAAIAALPDQKCDLCGGTGTRTDDLVPRICGSDTMPCNKCGASGRVRPWITHYDVELDHLQEWATFLVHCGGFEIW